jgi:hypothetical protein
MDTQAINTALEDAQAILYTACGKVVTKNQAAWKKLYHATEYLKKQQAELLAPPPIEEIVDEPEPAWLYDPSPADEFFTRSN